MKDVVLVGIQGSGKGTQGKILAEKAGYHIVATGDYFRSLTENDSPLARRVRELIDAGNMVPDDIVMEIVEDLMADMDPEAAILFDGVPRTEPQRKIFEALLAEKGRAFHVIHIDISEEESFSRLMSRAEIEGRADDTADAITKRIAAFHARTSPMISAWESKGIVKQVDGMGSIEEIAQRISAALERPRCKNCQCA